MRLLMQGLISRGHECKLLVMRSSDKPSDVEDADDPNVILCGQGRVHKTRTADPVIHAILDLQHTMRLFRTRCDPDPDADVHGDRQSGHRVDGYSSGDRQQSKRPAELV